MLSRGDFDPGAYGTLAGVRVLDLSHLAAGNAVTRVLADFGAEVIKVEPPGGDPLRANESSDVGSRWKHLARNMKSLALDLEGPEGRDLLLKLLPTAHVLVESFGPGTLERLGLFPELLLRYNAKLVVVRLSGADHDEPDGKRRGSPAGRFAELYGATGVMIALREVEVKNGVGQVIDLPISISPFTDSDNPERASEAVTPRLSNTPGSVRTPAPRLGEHNRAILAGVGVDDAAYAGLLAGGAVSEEAAVQGAGQ